MTIKKCRDCGLEKPVSEYWKQNQRGNLQSYCKPCSSTRAKKFQVKKPKVILPKIACDVCNLEFQPVKKWQKRCSAKCGYTFQNQKSRNPRVDGSCMRCGNSLAGKRRNAIYCSKSCLSMDHGLKHRSKTFTRNTARRLEIFVRDNQQCYMCGIHLEKHEFELDHLVPVKRDGDSDPSNLAVSCMPCNRRRGTTIGIRQLAKLFELRPRF